MAFLYFIDQRKKCKIPNVKLFEKLGILCKKNKPFKWKKNLNRKKKCKHKYKK